MKRIGLLIVGLLVCSVGAKGQSIDIQEAIEAQYIDASHKAFIYQVSPQTKARDLLLFNMEKERLKSMEEALQNSRAKLIINTDTTWGFTETMVPGDSVYLPYEYNHSWTEGDDINNGKGFYNFYTYRSDSAKWYPKSKQIGTQSEASSADSLTHLYYQNWETEPYYGRTVIAMKEPADGATSETYYDQYSLDKGWYKYQHTLNYQDENDYESITDTYDEVDMMYKRSSEQRYITTDEYQLSSSKYYDTLDQDRPLYSWSYSYTQYGENRRTEYQVSKRLAGDRVGLVGQDSIRFIYKDDFVEGQQYKWQDTVWVITNFYRSFQRTFENPDPTDEFHPFITKVDSVVIYNVYPDSLDAQGNLVVGEAISRTEFIYDEDGSQSEIRIFNLVEGELLLIGKTVREFNLVGESKVQVGQDVYVYDSATGMLYHAGIQDWLYTDEGVYTGYEGYTLSAAGDTINGNGNRTVHLEDGNTAYVTLAWDYTLEKLVVSNYRVIRSTSFPESHYINQTSYIYPTTGRASRNMTVSGSYPGVFNDGPIIANIGDTLSFYVSTRNIDMSIPQVEVTNMPETATFDPETRKFYWVVDEENPSPMTYTATNTKGISSIEVLFGSIGENSTGGGSVGTNNEDSEIANTFELMQNYPNPFNPTTNISFNLPKASDVSLKVYNMLGQEVASLVNGKTASGLQTVTFDASALSSGMYIYRIQAGSFLETRKMMLIK